MKRMGLVLALIAMSSLGLATPVLGAAPSNDVYDNRVVVGTLPFNDVIDTTEATTDAFDTEALGECQPPAVDASVWYELTPEADGPVVIDASASSYAVGILVVIGSPGGFQIIACAPGGIVVQGTAGMTLTILVFDYDGDGNGGTLDLSIAQAPPPPVLDLVVARSGSVDQRTGVATIRGTITCTGGDGLGKNFIDVQLIQAVGRLMIRAAGGTGFSCDGTAEPWAVELVGESGRLGGGKVTVSVFAFSCAYECATVSVDRTVTLSR